LKRFVSGKEKNKSVHISKKRACTNDFRKGNHSTGAYLTQALSLMPFDINYLIITEFQKKG